MENKEIIQELNNIKSQVTALGHKALKSRLPISLDETPKFLKPFADLEIAVDKSIKKINSN